MPPDRRPGRPRKPAGQATHSPAPRGPAATGQSAGGRGNPPPVPSPAGGPPHPKGRRRGGRDRTPKSEGGPYWIFGRHAVQAALGNPQRRFHRLLVAPRAAAAMHLPPGRQVEEADLHDLSRLLPPGAVHQGVAALVAPLEAPGLRDWLAQAGGGARLVVVLDQVTDPQNVGAILRSATAFGAAAVITTAAHAPEEGGALAKAASGALDMLPYLRETNLARALDELADAGFWRIALDAEGSDTLAGSLPRDRPVALVLGAEGGGLRRLTRERCDSIARLPIRPEIGSLNVAQAATAALYEVARGGGDGAGP